MPRTVTVKRATGWYGIFRKLVILVDEVEQGSLKRNQSMSVTLPDQDGTLVGSMDWARTDEFPLQDVTDGATITIRGQFTLNERKNLGIDTMPFSFEVTQP